jgi:predicted molibdopterin-dependent oxidoreductase YjgC
VEVLVLLGADPVADFPDRALAELALERAGTVIAVDQFLTESSSRADIVLAAAGWAEVDGTTTNLEGRVLRLNQKVTPPGTARSDWMIAAELAARLGGDLGLDSTEAIGREMGELSTPHHGLAVGRDGTLAEGTSVPFEAVDPPPPRPLNASSVRLVVTDKLYDDGTLTQHSPSLAPLAPAPAARLHPEDFEGLGVADGTPVTVSSTVGRLTLPVVPDAGVGRGTVALVAKLAGAEVNRLLSADVLVTDVRVDTNGPDDRSGAGG